MVKDYQRYINQSVEEAKMHRAILEKVQDKKRIV